MHLSLTLDSDWESSGEVSGDVLTFSLQLSYGLYTTFLRYPVRNYDMMSTHKQNMRAQVCSNEGPRLFQGEIPGSYEIAKIH